MELAERKRKVEHVLHVPPSWAPPLTFPVAVADSKKAASLGEAPPFALLDLGGVKNP